MNNAQNRKIIAAVLGLAVIALVVDKAVLGGGATQSLAADGVLPLAVSAAGPSPAGSAGLGAVSAQTQTVTSQLENLKGRLDADAGAQVSDAFAPPQALADLVAADLVRRKAEERLSKATELASKLREQLHLTATATTSKRGAMINGTLYALGSEVPGTGFRLTAIDRDGVVLEDMTTKATIRLELNNK